MKASPCPFDNICFDASPPLQSDLTALVDEERAFIQAKVHYVRDMEDACGGIGRKLKVSLLDRCGGLRSATVWEACCHQVGVWDEGRVLTLRRERLCRARRHKRSSY